MDVGCFGVGRDDSIIGEDIGVKDGIENMASRGKGTAFGVKENEMVGKIGWRRKEGLDV